MDRDYFPSLAHLCVSFEERSESWQPMSFLYGFHGTLSVNKSGLYSMDEIMFMLIVHVQPSSWVPSACLTMRFVR